MAINIQKEALPDMTYAEIEAWHAQYPKFNMKPNLATYILWKDGMFMGEGDFFHKQPDGSYRYSHTVNYEDPQDYPETFSGDGQQQTDAEDDGYAPPEIPSDEQVDAVDTLSEPVP
jgi:hypothetical protein